MHKSNSVNCMYKRIERYNVIKSKFNNLPSTINLVTKKFKNTHTQLLYLHSYFYIESEDELHGPKLLAYFKQYCYTMNTALIVAFLLMSQVIKTAVCPSLQYFFNPSIRKVTYYILDRYFVITSNKTHHTYTILWRLFG